MKVSQNKKNNESALCENSNVQKFLLKPGVKSSSTSPRLNQRRFVPPDISPPLPSTAPPSVGVKTPATLSSSYNNVADSTQAMTVHNSQIVSPTAPAFLHDRFMIDLPTQLKIDTHSTSGRPPPSYNFAQHIYDALEPIERHKWIFYLAFLGIIFSVTCIAIAITSVVIPDLRQYFILYEPCWTTPLYLINAVVGIAAARLSKVNFFVTHLILSVLCIVFSVILVILGSVDWAAAGRLSMGVNCILFKRDYDQLTKLHYSMNFDFERCVWTFKLALTFWTTLMILAVLLGVINLASMVLCILRTGNCKKCWKF